MGHPNQPVSFPSLPLSLAFALSSNSFPFPQQKSSLIILFPVGCCGLFHGYCHFPFPLFSGPRSLCHVISSSPLFFPFVAGRKPLNLPLKSTTDGDDETEGEIPETPTPGGDSTNGRGRRSPTADVEFDRKDQRPSQVDIGTMFIR